MRITGGYYKNTVIKSPKGQDVRPTSDRVREALFSILADKTENAVFLDLFAGSGVVGIEALSRGAKTSIFIEKNIHCVKIIGENLQKLGLREENVLIKSDVFSAILRRLGEWGEKIDLIYCDPPYKNNYISEIIAALKEKRLLKMGGMLIIEHSKKNDIKNYDNLFLFDKRQYGETMLSFLLNE